MSHISQNIINNRLRKDIMNRFRTDNRGLVNEKVKFDLSYARRVGTVIKNNNQTVILYFVNGANTLVRIKRHKIKHNVRRYYLNENVDKYAIDVMWETGDSSYAKSLLE